jgi:DHA3 family macrolide efflux protein-like MFS transporter
MIEPASWKPKAAAFLGSQALSLLGTSLVQYALMWYVTLETKSGIMMTLFVVCGFVPTFLLSPFAGVWADRYDRKRLIMLSDGLIALITLALALAVAAGGRALWLVFLASGLRAVGTAVQGPAVGAIVPQFVPEDRLMRINGLSTSLQSAITLVSPVLSGALVSLVPMQTVFLIDLATAALAIGVLFFFLPVPPHARAVEPRRPTYGDDLRLGFRYVREHRYLVPFFAYLAAVLFLVSPAAFLTPLQVTRTYGADVWRLTAIEVAFSAGMMAGGAVLSAWGGLPNRIHTMLLATFAMGGLTVGLGLAPAFWLYLAIMAAFGVVLPFYNAPGAVLLQDHVEPAYLGRVFSILTMLSTSMMPLGMLLFGPLAEFVRIEWMLLGTGAIMAALGVAVLSNRHLVEAGRKPERLAGAASTTDGADARHP